jgi:hypothetical protein
MPCSQTLYFPFYFYFFQHWLRRQIGSLLPEQRDHARHEWIIEEVRCLTGRDILQEWAVSSTSGMKSTDPNTKKK